MNKNVIVELAKQCPGMNLSVKADELLDAINYCIYSAHKELEQLITDANAETYPGRQKVAEILNIDLSTLHRWSKSGYLVPIAIGGKRRYRMSDVKRILGG